MNDPCIEQLMETLERVLAAVGRPSCPGCPFKKIVNKSRSTQRPPRSQRKKPKDFSASSAFKRRIS